jgi:hypothetical protein
VFIACIARSFILWKYLNFDLDSGGRGFPLFVSSEKPETQIHFGNFRLLSSLIVKTIFLLAYREKTGVLLSLSSSTALKNSSEGFQHA